MTDRLRIRFLSDDVRSKIREEQRRDNEPRTCPLCQEKTTGAHMGRRAGYTDLICTLCLHGRRLPWAGYATGGDHGGVRNLKIGALMREATVALWWLDREIKNANR